MRYFDEQTLSKLEQLARIRCTPQEEQKLLDSLNRIVEYVHLLDAVDTTNVPMSHATFTETFDATLRNDTIGEILDHDQFLASAPDQMGGMIRIPPVFKDL